MGKRGTPDRPDHVSAVAEVVVVEVTVRGSPRPRGSRLRIAGSGRAVGRRAVAVLAPVLAIALTASVWLGARSSQGASVNPLTRIRGPAGVAAAYGYPPGCLSVTILETDPTYARADFNHQRLCGRYAGYPTAIFHYRSGIWRPVLVAATYLCPVDSLPATVQRQLGVCQDG